MTKTRSASRGDTAAAWWRVALADRDSGAARGLAARLRRGGAAATLGEPAVHDLARRLGMGPGQAPQLVRLAEVLAEVRADDPAPLARRLGGPEPVLSTLRFQRLLRATADDFTAQLRRALAMADRRCNVGRLAGDLLLWEHSDWSDPVRARWSFDYFGAPPPAQLAPSTHATEPPA